MATDAQKAEKAAATIEKKGRLVTFLKGNRTAADSTKPWRGNAGTPATGSGGGDFDAYVAFVPISGSGLGRDLGLSEEQLKRSRQVGLFSAAAVPAGVDVETYDQILDGDRIWSINGVGTLQPGQTAIIHGIALGR